jgi:AcrR family transcriptional regulator
MAVKGAAEKNAYHAHRERQRRRIFDAARRLFDERGIDRVTMAEITAGSGLQPSTVYQYFSNKDDIVWEIVNEIMVKASEDAARSLEGAPDGLAKITRLLEYLAGELANNQAGVRFMAQFDAMYARDWPAERLLTLEAQVNPQGLHYFEDLISEGIADGSLRPDLDPKLTMHAVINTVIGAQRRLASLGKKVELEYGQPIDRLFRETIRVLVLGLRATESFTTKSSARAKARKSTTRRRIP